jgi:hypothetical protein
MTRNEANKKAEADAMNFGTGFVLRTNGGWDAPSPHDVFVIKNTQKWAASNCTKKKDTRP